MGLLKKFAGETLVYGISVVLTRLISFVFLAPYLTNKFNDSPDLYGIHAIMYSYAALILILYTHRMETAFFRFGSRSKDYSKYFGTAFGSVLALVLVSTALMLLFSREIASILTSPEHARYVVWFAFIMAFDALAAIPFAKLRLDSKPVPFAVIKLINVGITVLVTLFLLEAWPAMEISIGSWNYDYDRRLDYVFIANLIASGCVMVILLPGILRLRIRFNTQQWRKMVRYAWPLIIVGVAGTINNFADRFLIKELSAAGLNGEAEAGLYSAAARIAMLMMLFTTAFNYAAEPFFFRQATASNNRQVYAVVARIFTIVACVIFLFVTLFMPLIQHLLGSSYRQSLYVAPILLLAYLFLGLHYNFSIWYKITDRTSVGAIIASLGSVISLSVNFALIGRIGYEGAAWAALATFLFMAVAGYWTSRRFYPIPYPVVSIGGYIVLALLLYFAGEYLSQFVTTGWSYLISVGILGVYAAVIYLADGKKIRREINAIQ
jgi:O-antigen/teichoic acid export membrane protein